MIESGRVFLEDEAATEAAGRSLARAVRGACGDPVRDQAVIVYLQGDLGAGKTCLARGVMRGFGHAGAVKSPTYTLVEPYEDLPVPVCHFDLYRLSDAGEVEFLGVEDCFGPGRLCLVEWPDRGAGSLPAADIIITMTSGNGGRWLAWEVPAGPLADNLAKELTLCA